MIVTTASFQLYPEATLRTNTIKRNGTTTPGLNFPYIGLTVTPITVRVALPAVHFATLARTPTTRTAEKLCLKALFAAQVIVAASSCRHFVPVLPRESFSTDRANKPAAIPTGFAVFFSQVERVESDNSIVSVRPTPTTVAEGILGGVTFAATVFIVRTDPEVVALAPIVIAEHLAAIRAHRVKVVNALRAHWPLGRVFQITGD
jgi:hypothetical protein